jgi:hypothetical protein
VHLSVLYLFSTMSKIASKNPIRKLNAPAGRLQQI